MRRRRLRGGAEVETVETAAPSPALELTLRQLEQHRGIERCDRRPGHGDRGGPAKPHEPADRIRRGVDLSADHGGARAALEEAELALTHLADRPPAWLAGALRGADRHRWDRAGDLHERELDGFVALAGHAQLQLHEREEDLAPQRGARDEERKVAERVLIAGVHPFDDVRRTPGSAFEDERVLRRERLDPLARETERAGAHA